MSDSTPTVEEVALLVLARTRDRNESRGQFTSTTKPTVEQVEGMIRSVTLRVLGKLGPSFDTTVVLGEANGEKLTTGDVLREAIATGTGARIELSLEPESASNADSAYAKLNQEYEDALEVLVQSTTNDPGDSEGFESVAITSPTLAAAARYPCV